MSVVIETTLGDFTVDLYVKERPKCSFNFIKLCKMKYYNSCLFHRIERDFIAQTGDPTGEGSGGGSVFGLIGDSNEGTKHSGQVLFPREVKPKLRHEKKGTLSMVNNGHDLHGSQFFLTLADGLDSLDDGGHTVFGYVAEGLNIITQLNQELCDNDHKPYREIRITHTVILDDPFEDPASLFIPDRSPLPPESVFESMDKIGIGEEVDETAGKSLAEIEEEIAAKEAAARATILEMVGDLPDADVAPPDNVLFICKLNPVTRDEDLEVIFSRFGPIVSCEVIRDVKTGESLQYAFIEFESASDCEKAYFKMDNVLIDDRRIHVDFSQSVAKYKWHRKSQPAEAAPPKESSAVGGKKHKLQDEHEVRKSQKTSHGHRDARERDYERRSDHDGRRRRDSYHSERRHHRSRSRERDRDEARRRERSRSRDRRRDETRRREMSHDRSRYRKRHSRDRSKDRYSGRVHNR